MRTMYIILSWIGWGWFTLAMPALWYALARQRRRESPPAVPVGTEAERHP